MPASSRVVTSGTPFASNLEMFSVTSAKPASRRKSEESPATWVATRWPPSSSRNQAARVLVRRCNSSTACCTTFPYCCALDDAVGNGLHGLQPAGLRSRFIEHQQQHARAEGDFESQYGRGGNRVGERRPGKMKQRQARGQQPGRRGPASATRPQNRNRRSQQDDAVADFNGHAQWQRVRPQQHPRSSKSRPGPV